MIGRRNSLLLTSTSPLTFSRPIISPSFPDDFSRNCFCRLLLLLLLDFLSTDYFSTFLAQLFLLVAFSHFSTFLHISLDYFSQLASTNTSTIKFPLFSSSHAEKKRYNNFPSFLRFFPPLAEPSDSSVKDKPGG